MGLAPLENWGMLYTSGVEGPLIVLKRASVNSIMQGLKNKLLDYKESMEVFLLM